MTRDRLHLWILDRGDYDWLTPDQECLYRDFEPANLAPLIADAGINRTVLVQAAPTIAETLYLLELARQHEFIAGVVGWVDMDLGEDAAEDVIRLVRDDKFLGIRPMIQDIEDPAWMLNLSLGPVFETLIDLDLSFDALVKPAHLPYLSTLLARYPELKTVVDHGAKPNIGAGEWEPWADELAAIAENTNAFCKLSGLVSETRPQQSNEVLWPYCQQLLDQFGARRLMWRSDWPVLNLRCDYATWHDAFLRWLAPLDDDEKGAILGHTAIEFYRLRMSGC